MVKPLPAIIAAVWALGAAALDVSLPATPVRASSTHSNEYLPDFAVDGDAGTRWASRAAGGAAQWLAVDLGATIEFDRLTIVWERALAMAYDVEVSADGETWERIHRFEAEGGPRAKLSPAVHRDELSGLSARGRHLRILCHRGGFYKLYSIWELEFPEPAAAAAVSAGLHRGYGARREAEARLRRESAAVLLEHGARDVVYAVREEPVDGHWYANFAYYAPDANRMCYRAGGRLCKWNAETGETSLLIDDPDGSVRDPAVHYDGRTIVFSWRKAGSRYFHLYEIQADGSGLRQITDGPYDDIEPCYLPDDELVFVSSRCRRWVNCWLTHVGVLYRCDRDGGSMRRLSANVEHDNTPWVMPDGRIIYQRWEYVDRSQVHYHHLWSAYPDGTGQMILFGNLHPGGVFIDAKPIPGGPDIVLTNSPGHGQKEHRGSLAILSPRGGPDDGGRMVSITGGGFCDPYPLSAGWFLAARGREMVLVHRDGLIASLTTPAADLGNVTLHEPRPLVARSRERTVAERVDTGQTDGTLVLHDVYRGRSMDGVEPGTIASLLVLESLPKPINYTGGMEPLSYGGTFTLERVIGKVPVEADGSAHFRVPANRAFFFVALDEQDRSVKRMQSFFSVAPGETLSCVGCHEPRTETPANPGDRPGVSLALRRPAAPPVPVRELPEVFDFARDVQPIFDRRCLGCHGAVKRAGGVSLTGHHGPLFSHSYFALSARGQVSDGRNLPRSNYPPRAIGDSASPLMAKLEPSHHRVQVNDHERRVVQYWINSGAAWPGTYGALGSGMVGGYAQNRIDRRDLQWPETKAAMDVLKRRCASCHQGGMALPMSVSDNQGMPPWAVNYASPKLRFSRHRIYDLSVPAESLLVLAPLARSAGGRGMVRRAGADGRRKEIVEVFSGREDPDYRALLAGVARAGRQLQEIKRFTMPHFRPPEPYLREMVRYGVLPEIPPADSAVDCYALDRAYWRLFDADVERYE